MSWCQQLLSINKPSYIYNMILSLWYLFFQVKILTTWTVLLMFLHNSICNRQWSFRVLYVYLVKKYSEVKQNYSYKDYFIFKWKKYKLKPLLCTKKIHVVKEYSDIPELYLPLFFMPWTKHEILKPNFTGYYYFRIN